MQSCKHTEAYQANPEAYKVRNARAKVLPATKHYPRRAPPSKKEPRPKFEYKHEEAKYRVDLKRDLRVRGIPFNKEAKTEILEKTHERVGETYPRVTVMGGIFSNLHYISTRNFAGQKPGGKNQLCCGHERRTERDGASDVSHGRRRWKDREGQARESQ